jgi:hypothetical protein
LAAFGRRPPVDVARLSMAGIRNPAQSETPKHVRAGGSFRRKQPWRPHQRTPCDTLELAKTMLTMLLKCQPPRLGAAENAEME